MRVITNFIIFFALSSYTYAGSVETFRVGAWKEMRLFLIRMVRFCLVPRQRSIAMASP